MTGFYVMSDPLRPCDKAHVKFKEKRQVYNINNQKMSILEMVGRVDGEIILL